MIKRVLFVLFYYVPQTFGFSFIVAHRQGATVQQRCNARPLHLNLLTFMEKLPTATLQR